MRVQIAARHCEVPDSARVRVEEQMQKLSKYDPRVSSADIVFEVEKHIKKVEGILSVDRDEPVIATGEGREFRAAIDRMAGRLARILRRRRSQATDHQAPRISEPEQAAAE
ncbi:MAG TPA: ribosome-associated translation inhibitor RaiA [Longimicrobiales bacterium]|jgi:ribosomal subunit interface protein